MLCCCRWWLMSDVDVNRSYLLVWFIYEVVIVHRVPAYASPAAAAAVLVCVVIQYSGVSSRSVLVLSSDAHHRMKDQDS